MTSTAHSLDTLYARLLERKKTEPDKSYTARLYAAGTGKIAQKVGEEAVEVVIEAMREDKDCLRSESADLLYHLLVLWADQGIAPQEIWAELDKRVK